MKNKYCLRVIDYPEKYGTKEILGIFEGNIKKDKAYWKKTHNAVARYFELKELSI